MTPIQEFQKKHGEAWSKIVRSAPFNDAMLLLNLEKNDSITALTPAEIKENGSEILADLVGHLKHENALMTLHERRTFDPTDLPPETYSPEDQDEPAVASREGGRKRKRN